MALPNTLRGRMFGDGQRFASGRNGRWVTPMFASLGNSPLRHAIRLRGRPRHRLDGSPTTPSTPSRSTKSSASKFAPRTTATMKTAPRCTCSMSICSTSKGGCPQRQEARPAIGGRGRSSTIKRKPSRSTRSSTATRRFESSASASPQSCTTASTCGCARIAAA